MRQTLRFSFLFCTVMVLGLFSTICSAQALEPEHYSFKVGSWELNALKSADNEFLGFWAIPRTELAVGNIRRMWFESLPNDEWDVYAYEPVSANAKAAELYASGMSDQSLEFFYSRERKALAAFSDQDVNGGVEGLIVKGFIDGDPLTETVAALSDPTPMIDLLADVNYAVAPGMSELLVSGTAGSTVNMNQATKQLLDCIRASMSASCGTCVCIETEGMITHGPWTVRMTPMPPPSEQVRCDYSRIVTHTFYQSGFYPELCTDCSVGSVDNPATWTELEEYTDMWLDITECPPSPVWPR